MSLVGCCCLRFWQGVVAVIVLDRAGRDGHRDGDGDECGVLSTVRSMRAVRLRGRMWNDE